MVKNMACLCIHFICIACTSSCDVINFNLVYVFRMSVTAFHHGLGNIQALSIQEKSLSCNKLSHLSLKRASKGFGVEVGPWQRCSPNNLRLRPIQVSTPHSSVDNPSQLFENNKPAEPKKKSSKQLVFRDFFVPLPLVPAIFFVLGFCIKKWL